MKRGYKEGEASQKPLSKPTNPGQAGGRAINTYKKTLIGEKFLYDSRTAAKKEGEHDEDSDPEIGPEEEDYIL